MMQAFTAMREWLATLGMLAFPPVEANSKNSRKRKQYECEDFFSLFGRPYPNGMNWKINNEKKQNHLEAFFELIWNLDSPDLLELKAHIKTMRNTRNGFDHGWTGQSPQKLKKAHDEANHFLDLLKGIYLQLQDKAPLIQKHREQWKETT
jgi:transposase InsO family protein